MPNDIKYFGVLRAPNNLHQQIRKQLKEGSKADLSYEFKSNYDGEGNLNPAAVAKNLITTSFKTAVNGGILGLRAGNVYRGGAKYVVGRGQKLENGTRVAHERVDSWAALKNAKVRRENGVLGVVFKRLGASLSAGAATLVADASKAPGADNAAQTVIGKVNDVLRLPLVHGPAVAACVAGTAVGAAIGITGLVVAGAALASIWVGTATYKLIKNALTTAAQDTNKALGRRSSSTGAAPTTPAAMPGAEGATLPLPPESPRSEASTHYESATGSQDGKSSASSYQTARSSNPDQDLGGFTIDGANGEHGENGAASPMARRDSVPVNGVAWESLLQEAGSPAEAQSAEAPKRTNPWHDVGLPNPDNYGSIGLLRHLAQGVRHGAPVSPGYVELRALSRLTEMNFHVDGPNSKSMSGAKDGAAPPINFKNNGDGTWSWAHHAHNNGNDNRVDCAPGSMDGFYDCVTAALDQVKPNHTLKGESLREAVANHLDLKVIQMATTARGLDEVYVDDARHGIEAALSMGFPEEVQENSGRPALTFKHEDFQRPLANGDVYTVQGGSFPHPGLETPHNIVRHFAEEARQMKKTGLGKDAGRMGTPLEASALANALNRRIVLWTQAASRAGDNGKARATRQAQGDFSPVGVNPADIKEKDVIHVVHDGGIHWQRFHPEGDPTQASSLGRIEDCGSHGNSCLYLSVHGTGARENQKELAPHYRNLTANEMIAHPDRYVLWATDEANEHLDLVLEAQNGSLKKAKAELLKNVEHYMSQGE